MDAWLISTVVTLFHLAGIACALRAVFTARSPQGAIAWTLTLVLFPYLAVPAYLVFGRNSFRNYVRARRAEDLLPKQITDTAAEQIKSLKSDRADAGPLRALDRLARAPFSHGNRVELLVDGKQTFDRIFEAIDAAQRYLLVQFYILRDDGLGRELRDRLAARAREGVEVYFLYDEIGSNGLPRSYLDTAKAAGIDIRSFHTTQGRTNRFQLNFRNHRKIVVADGSVAFVGGHNVGDEYLGKDPKFGAWRDTHVRIQGPMVVGVQMSFAEDWHWRAKRVPAVIDWTPRAAEDGDANGIVVPSGPADDLETCSLMFAHLIHSARERIWFATPYFVPDDASMAALKLAVMRGLDVRVLVPKNSDSTLVQLGSMNYIEEALAAGVKVMHYAVGFMHQKVALVDDLAAAIGTANMDNRSFRLNFEITAIVVDRGFANDVEKMLQADMERCEPIEPGDLARMPLLRRLGVKVARLFSPIL